jgi:L-asparaginase
VISILTTGGTIDKIYFDAKSDFAIGDTLLSELLTEANIHEGYSLRELMRKDSLEITDEDRNFIAREVGQTGAQRILITHGTDTMTQTAQALKGVTGKTVVLFGAMQPARMRRSDAVFNLGFAWAAVSLLSEGVYIAMNGEVFEAGAVRKNLEAKRFERT